jgi:hypothetical protein
MKGIFRKTEVKDRWVSNIVILLFAFAFVGLLQSTVQAQQTCHPPKKANHEGAAVARRGDVKHLPQALKDQLVLIAKRPHNTRPTTAFAEADSPSLLFQYYLIDTTGFEQNIFTTIIPGINDFVGQTAANAANCGLSTLGAVRVVLEPKPGLPTDPNDPGAFIDIFTDITNLFVINNESGWYEGWMIHDLIVAPIANPRPNGTAAFGTITATDAAALALMGSGNNVPGATFTQDGNVVHLPSASDVFPNTQTNVVALHLSMGAYNCLQQSDCHAYWEFNQYSDWIHPLYELPFTGGFPADFNQAPNAYEQGRIGLLSTLIPGSGPSGVQNTPQAYGDNPNIPRDPDRALNFDPEDQTNDDHKETRLRFIPSGLANEVFLDVFERPVSFEPGVTTLEQRLNDAYAYEISLIDLNADGVVDFVEGDLEGTSDGGQSNDRLYLPAPAFNRFAVTREINDGYLAPRFAQSQRGWVLSGFLTAVNPPVPASVPRDSDDR